MTQNHIEYYQVKRTTYMFVLEIRSPKFHSVQWLAISRISAISYFHIGHNVKFQSFFVFFLNLIPKYEEVKFVWTATGERINTLAEKES